jgi:hypothetical protein
VIGTGGDHSGSGGSHAGAAGSNSGTGGYEAGASGAAGGVCEQDSDCEFRKNVGCCGVCLARNDPSPGGACPPGAGECAPSQPNCVCINHHCGTGTLTQAQTCSATHDLCGFGLKCCPACDGSVAASDGGCSTFSCSIAYPSATGNNACSL